MTPYTRTRDPETTKVGQFAWHKDWPVLVLLEKVKEPNTFVRRQVFNFKTGEYLRPKTGRLKIPRLTQFLTKKAAERCIDKAQ